MDILMNFLPSIICGLFLYYFKRAQDKKDEEREEKADVQADIINATMELTYANSIALEKRQFNGELKKARDSYDEAVKRRDKLAQKELQK